MPLEKDARVRIDEQLAQAGWVIQDLYRINIATLRYVAIREFPLTTGEADYLLVIDGNAVGVVEAKKQGTTLTGVKEQSMAYQAGQPLGVTQVRFPFTPLPFS
jgi:type I restriction enzyme R subunit